MHWTDLWIINLVESVRYYSSHGCRIIKKLHTDSVEGEEGKRRQESLSQFNRNKEIIKSSDKSVKEESGHEEMKDILHQND